MPDAEIIKIGINGRKAREDRASAQVARAATRARGGQRRSSGLISGDSVTGVAPDPLVVKPVPDPVAPDPVAPDPVAPDPVAPDPVAPDPVAPDHSVPRQPRTTPRPAAKPRGTGKAAPGRVHDPAQGAAADETPSAADATDAGSGRRQARSVPIQEPDGAPGPSGPVGWALEKVAWALVASARRVAGSEWERTLAAALAFLRRRITGDYEVDEFGFDPHLNDAVFMSVLRPLYRAWFRVEVRGIENVPAQGGALLVANHSGTIALDSLMTQLALLDEHAERRHLRMLGADLVFSTPFVSELARKGGTTLACQSDAERLLRAGEVVGVWPEGFKGIGKPFSERYKLQRFGRGGFVSAALRTGVPLVPVSIVGAEEIYPIIGQMGTLARLLGLPYAPITPTWPLLGPLGLVPLPSKWIIEFGEPVETDGYGSHAAEDPMLVFDLTDRVRETIQQTLYKLLMQRRSVFF